MKVTSFTGTLYAKRTAEHKNNYPDVETVKEFMAHKGIQSHDIYDMKMDDKYLSMTFKDSITGNVAGYIRERKLPYLILSETKNLLSTPIELIAKLLP